MHATVDIPESTYRYYNHHLESGLPFPEYGEGAEDEGGYGQDGEYTEGDPLDVMTAVFPGGVLADIQILQIDGLPRMDITLLRDEPTEILMQRRTFFTLSGGFILPSEEGNYTLRFLPVSE